MTEAGLFIPLTAYRTFSADARHEILGYFLAQFGAEPGAQVAVARDEKGLARLDITEAKQFLNNCNEKTTFILRQIVDRNGSFLMSEIARVLDCPIGDLRGAWAGLTKRVRTICNDREAKLINWYKRGNDWHGVMAAQTVESMRIALDERAEAMEG